MSITSQLTQNWPNYEGDEESFWTLEWNKHGTCSNMQPLDYFKLALEIYARKDLQKILKDANLSHGNSWNKSDIVAAIKTSTSVEPALSCEGRGDLSEIRLCLDKSASPQYMNCPSKGNCPQQINFKS